MWWISLCVCSLKEESAVLIFPSIISNPFILRFSISNPLKVSDWVEWSADSRHRPLSCPRLKERYWSSAGPNHQINSLCFSQTSSSGRDFDVTLWSERRMRESSFILSKRSMATLTKPHCPSNPPEQAFPLFRNKFGCPQSILVLSPNWEFCHYLHALVSLRTRVMLFLPMNTTWECVMNLLWKIQFLMSSLSYFCVKSLLIPSTQVY